jgi:hypothetical protein
MWRRSPSSPHMPPSCRSKAATQLLYSIGSSEQEVMRATLLTQRAGEDITEVLPVLSLTTGPLTKEE